MGVIKLHHYLFLRSVLLSPPCYIIIVSRIDGYSIKTKNDLSSVCDIILKNIFTAGQTETEIEAIFWRIYGSKCNDTTSPQQYEVRGGTCQLRTSSLKLRRTRPWFYEGRRG